MRSERLVCNWRNWRLLAELGNFPYYRYETFLYLDKYLYVVKLTNIYFIYFSADDAILL